MRNRNTVKLKTVASQLKLTPVHVCRDYENAVLTTADINRPAMQLTGFYNAFDPSRVQIMGIVETAYLETLSSEQRRSAFEKFMQYDIAALVICHKCQVFPECIEMAERFDRNVFYTEEDTSSFTAAIIIMLTRALAVRIRTSGVLVEVYGEGLLITGDSGIGKSEAALELVKRGHRIIADDAVDIKCIDKETLIGSAPPAIQYYMEMRGIGVINVKDMYGVGAVKPETAIDMIVHLERWDDNKTYERLGLVNETETILGVTLPKLTVPVAPGRNVAIITEVAAMNNRQKKMGFNAAETLVEAIDAAVDQGDF